MHLKRNKTPKSWPIKRKGTKYVARSMYNLKKSIPLLIIIRDILNLIKTRRELKKILNLKKIKINGKVVREEKYPLMLFDNLCLDNRNFRVIIKNKKFALAEIGEKESNEKIVKVIGKKLLKRGRMQINLSDGRNYISKEKIKTQDSVVINLKENKIAEILPFKEGCRVLLISGKRIGAEAEVISLKDKVIIKIGDEKINADQKSLMVINLGNLR